MAGAPHYLALAGGVGGARLADGLAGVLPADRLTVAVNTADDFEHLGLRISPDLDTVTYTLAGVEDPQTGWGRAGESWAALEALGALGGETWFRLGDRDLAVHLLRSSMARTGRPLSEIAAGLARALGVAHRVVPMTDDEVRTVVRTAEGALAFQDYFVRRGCAPAVAGFAFEGLAGAAPAPGLAECLEDPALAAVLVGPSNPYVSIAPIVGLPEVAAFLARRTVPAVAVSPIVGGAAVKGPLAKMMAELGAEVSAAGVAAHYGALIDGLVIDRADAALAARLRSTGLAVAVADTVMRDRAGRRALARTVLDFAAGLAPRAR